MNFFVLKLESKDQTQTVNGDFSLPFDLLFIYDVDSPMGYIDMVNTVGLVNVYNYVIPIGHIKQGILNTIFISCLAPDREEGREYTA